MSSPQLMAGLGAAAAIFFSSAGSAIASAHGGVFASKSSHAGIWSYAPIVISGVLAIYGLIVAILIQFQMDDDLDQTVGYRLLCSGIVVGLGCLSSGLGMSRFIHMYMVSHAPAPAPTGNGALVDANETSALLGFPKDTLPVTWTCIFSLVFLEAIGLYSLIVSLFMSKQ